MTVDEFFEWVRDVVFDDEGRTEYLDALNVMEQAIANFREGFDQDGEQLLALFKDRYEEFTPELEIEESDVTG
jgi:hypothetical protein